MSRFANALKKDLYSAEDTTSADGHYELSEVMGKLADVAEAMGKLIKSDMLTPTEEMNYFRSHLSANLDWHGDEAGLTDDEIARARKIVEELTATDHFQNLN